LDKEDENGRIIYYDGFSRRAGRQKRAFLPNCLFFDVEKGLIPLLEKYNFTIEENTPNDLEVALDPELLGNVFENLLGVYNPETKETARKQSGSFYTPREIVNYMVDESLLAYLNTVFPDIGQKTFQQMFNSETLPLELQNLPELNGKIAKKLKEAKILDPACGSGAFPMGVLNRMLDLLKKLHSEDEHSTYDLKLQLIENCIYGIDIQTIAVQISKLRFFISLICEQIPTHKADENYGITSLPNLETKFVAANTLLGLKDDFSDKLDFQDENLMGLKNKLWDIRHKHFLAGNANEKHSLRKEDEKLRGQIKKYLIERSSNSDSQKVSQWQKEIERLKIESVQYVNEKWEDVTEPSKLQSEFDFGFEPKISQQQSLFRMDVNKQRRVEIDSQIKRIQNEINRELSKTINIGFEVEADKLAHWDPYNQNKSSEFFDAEWMFGIKDGFDIIIGNPPYKSLTKNNSPELSKYSSIFKSFEKSSSKNIFILFIEKALQLLSKNSTLSFIVPEGLFKTRSYSGCVDIINNAGFVRKDVIFKSYVFENAVTGSLIFVFNNNQKGNTHHYQFDERFFLSRIESSGNPIIDKILKDSSLLKNVAILFKGMVIKDRDLVLSLDSNGKKNKFLLGKNISRWIVTSSFYTNYNELEIVGGTKKLEKHNQIPRILIRRTGDTLCCAYLSEIALTESTLYSCWSLNSKLSNKYIISLLNSKLLNYYNKKLNITNQQGFPQILMTDLEELPIKTTPYQFPFISIVDQILLVKAENPQADTTLFERQIDEMVYKLYDLTYDEVKIIDPDFWMSEEEYERLNVLSEDAMKESPLV
jgi:hypothetical protein